MGRAIEELDERLRPLAQQFLEGCWQAGLPVLITCTRRTAEEQEALYAQGRWAPGRIVTNARAGESPHNHGLAFDVAFRGRHGVTWEAPRAGGWEEIGRIGERLGLVWGGRWRKWPDRPHFEIAEWKDRARGRGRDRSRGPDGEGEGES